MSIPNYVKENVTIYFPAIMELIGTNNFNWNEVEEIYNSENIKRIKKLEAQGTDTLRVEANIYDIIVEVKKFNRQAIRLLDFFNKSLFHLNAQLNENEKKLIISNIWNVLTALDKRYLDFFSELAVLNNTILAGEFRLDNIEYELPNGKTIDFRFKSIKDGKFILVEVFNIHLNSEKVDSDDTLVKKFLDGRLIPKINNKKEGLTEDIHFDLMPVLWGRQMT
ncbi:hypothetical protein HGH93_31220 [Chitinophaga polysaccharea]|uniref:hypothetical protein n=1 Tax=Chitinophaga polysaccharea TaxID=1293035 RepID=UPI00145576F5|nr:hypothetical protein [Chitinophaga polysaccharea]NLR62603.1 hypothetical protein [Chitinophaga polysaccharea]